MQVTVNNQLFLLMWVERLTLAGFKVISANTDGLTTYVPKNKLDLYHKVCQDWCDYTGYTLEFAEYEQLIMTAVNDYVAVKPGNLKFEDKYKFKGATFLQEARMGKGMKLPLVVPKAIFSYFVDGTPVEDFIKNYKDIKHFTRFEKVGKQFKVYWGSEQTQRVNRFYVSQDGKYLSKVNDADPNKIKRISILKDVKVNLLNKFDDRPFEEYNIDFNYYIEAANKIIEQFTSYIYEPFWDPDEELIN